MNANLAAQSFTSPPCKMAHVQFSKPRFNFPGSILHHAGELPST